MALQTFAWRPEPPVGVADGGARVLVAAGSLGDALGEAGVVAGFSTRVGGASVGPLGGANLGASVGDDPAAVLSNRRGVLAALGLSPDTPVASLRQVHGARVVPVESDGRGPGGGSVEDPGDLPDREPEAAQARPWAELADAVPRPRADGVWTGRHGIALAVYGADCAPVLIADPAARLVAAVHAGWRGLAAGALEAGVGALSSAGGAPPNMVALVGPAAGSCCYEVGADVHDQVAARHPAATGCTRDGRRSLDIAAGAKSALERAGVGRVVAVGGCTICEPERWFSSRRDRPTGRHAGVIALVEPGQPDEPAGSPNGRSRPPRRWNPDPRPS